MDAIDTFQEHDLTLPLGQTKKKKKRERPFFEMTKCIVIGLETA